MTKRLEDIKYFIEIESKSECKLLLSDYKNSNSKLSIQCKCGELFYASFSNFKYGNQRQCKKCSGIIEGNKKEFNKILRKLEYEYISEGYKGNVHYIILKDYFGYFYKTVLGRLTKNILPDKFNKTNPYTIQNIKLWCKLNDKPFELLSEEYEGNNKKLKWKCLKDGCKEEFEITWGAISQGQSCPYCCNPAKQVGLSNCLATKRPDIASEWHPTLNNELTPYDVTYGSSKKVWWKCSKNPKHEWQSTISNRSNLNNGCPYCDGKYPSEDYNLLICNPKLCEEWNYEKNKKKPEEYTPGSSQKVWWKCKECGYEWKAVIGSRHNGWKIGCPECNKSKGEDRISKYFINEEFMKINDEDYKILDDIFKEKYKYYITQKKFKDLVGLNNGLLSYDFYLPNLQYNFLIEYDGEFHYKAIKLYKNEPIKYAEERLRKQQEHDRLKTEYAEKHNIKLLRIPYWDFDNIEEILDKEIKNLQCAI